MSRMSAIAALVASWMNSASAQATPNWFAIPGDAVYETGDTWTVSGARYRLYGVQACLRGTSFTNQHGIARDCGEASLAMLVSLVRDLKPQCYVAAVDPATQLKFVLCFATLTKGAGAGSRLDLATALISTGYSFASLTPDSMPVHMPYFIAQIVAQRSKAGLWQFPDMPEPNGIIIRAMRAAAPASSSPPSTQR